MKLTGSLKDKVDAVATKEEKKAIIAEAGMELTDDELKDVAGGGTFDFSGPPTLLKPQYTEMV